MEVAKKRDWFLKDQKFKMFHIGSGVTRPVFESRNEFGNCTSKVGIAPSRPCSVDPARKHSPAERGFIGAAPDGATGFCRLGKRNARF